MGVAVRRASDRGSNGGRGGGYLTYSSALNWVLGTLKEHDTV